jgi:hypothetical protein
MRVTLDPLPQFSLSAIPLSSHLHWLPNMSRLQTSVIHRDILMIVPCFWVICAGSPLPSQDKSFIGVGWAESTWSFVILQSPSLSFRGGLPWEEETVEEISLGPWKWPPDPLPFPSPHAWLLGDYSRRLRVSWSWEASPSIKLSTLSPEILKVAFTLGVGDSALNYTVRFCSLFSGLLLAKDTALHQVLSTVETQVLNISV